MIRYALDRHYANSTLIITPLCFSISFFLRVEVRLALTISSLLPSLLSSLFPLLPFLLSFLLLLFTYLVTSLVPGFLFSLPLLLTSPFTSCFYDSLHLYFSFLFTSPLTPKSLQNKWR